MMMTVSLVESQCQLKLDWALIVNIVSNGLCRDLKRSVYQADFILGLSLLQNGV